MASVETYATIVEKERYGKDVRQAIADGLRFVSKYTKKVLKITIHPSDWFIYDSKIDGLDTLNLYGVNARVKGIMEDPTIQLIKILPVRDEDKEVYEDYDVDCVEQATDILMFRTKVYKLAKPSSDLQIYVYTELLEPGVQGKNSVEYAVAIDTELNPDSGLPVANRTLYEKFKSCQKKSFIFINDLTQIFDIASGLSVERGNLVKNMNVVTLNVVLTAGSGTFTLVPFQNILTFKQETTKYGRIKPSVHTEIPGLVYLAADDAGKESWNNKNIWPVYDDDNEGFYSTQVQQTGVKKIKISGVWSVEEYVDYEFDNLLEVDIKKIFPDLIRDDVDIIIAEQTSTSNVHIDDDEEES